jgi:uncharacterized 2Fe-2S/4Fe-4S cluster protein (DUF4445 family)
LVSLGVVPSTASDVVRSAGNTALAGALALALDDGLWDEARSLPECTTHVDLAASPGFNDLLMRAVELEPFTA